MEENQHTNHQLLNQSQATKKATLFSFTLFLHTQIHFKIINKNSILIAIMTSTTRLQLSLSGKDLKNVSGLFEMSDPFAVVTSRGSNPDNKAEIIGRTDM